MLRKICFFLVAVLLGTSLMLGMGSVVAWAQGCITVNAGDPSTWGGAANAVDGIRKAILSSSDPGKICLKGTFDFSSKPVLVIGFKELSITGLADETGAGAKIINAQGSFAFTPPPTPSFPGAFYVYASGKDITIKDISFHNCGPAAIFVSAAKNVTITGNAITADTMQGRASSLGATKSGMGIAVGFFPPFPVVSGAVTIEDNYIDLEENVTPRTPQKEVDYSTYGIWSMSTTGAVNIRWNRVKNATSRGIATWDNPGTTTVEGNIIKAGPYNGYYNNTAYIGIFRVNGFVTPGVKGYLYIRNNTLECMGVDQVGIVVASLGNASLLGGEILYNDIKLQNGGRDDAADHRDCEDHPDGHDGPFHFNTASGCSAQGRLGVLGGIGLNSKGIVVRGNTIRGGCPALETPAIGLGSAVPGGTDPAEDCVIRGNDLSGATTKYAVYCFEDSAGNTIGSDNIFPHGIGICSGVVDLTDNPATLWYDGLNIIAGRDIDGFDVCAPLNLIDEVQSYNLKRWLEHRLEMELRKARACLDASNVCQRSHVVEELNEFKNECEEQRGKGLTSDQADKLIESANHIIQTLQ
jgi:hypothetical protein